MQQATQPGRPAQPAKPKAPTAPPEFQEGDIGKVDSAALVRILTDASAPEFQKAKSCQRAGEIGAKDAVPAMAGLLGNEHLSTYARYGLEPISDPSVDEALRSALTKLKGNFLIGVINSIGKRRDAQASSALAKMIYGSDVEVSRAALAALGSIGGPASMKELQAALGKTKGTVRTAAADAALMCAERLLAEGKREEAMALFASLSGPDVPKPMRLAAMNGIIREETSLTRPR